MMKAREPTLVTDGGPWAEHDMACPVLSGEKAMYAVGTGVFMPSQKAQDAGWMTIRPPRWLRGFLRRYEPHSLVSFRHVKWPRVVDSEATS